MVEKLVLRTGSAVITMPEEIAAIRQVWVESKEQELEAAQKAYVALTETGVSERKLKRVRERIGLLRKVVRALNAGYIPIPRFDSAKLKVDYQELPLKAIVAINEAAAQKLFDEFRFIEGREADNRRGP